jgi:hypothetical protein
MLASHLLMSAMCACVIELGCASSPQISTSFLHADLLCVCFVSHIHCERAVARRGPLAALLGVLRGSERLHTLAPLLRL